MHNQHKQRSSTVFARLYFSWRISVLIQCKQMHVSVGREDGDYRAESHPHTIHQALHTIHQAVTSPDSSQLSQMVHLHSTPTVTAGSFTTTPHLQRRLEASLLHQHLQHRLDQSERTSTTQASNIG